MKSRFAVRSKFPPKRPCSKCWGQGYRTVQWDVGHGSASYLKETCDRCKGTGKEP